MDFAPLKDRRLWLALGGGVVAIGAGVFIALGLGSKPANAPTAPPPASQGGLVVETTKDDDARLDPAAPLRCFVAGQFVGELTLGDCAKRNGVASGSLDVGVDENGALSAAQGAGTLLTPLPPSAAKIAAPSPPVAAPATPAAATPAPAAGPAPLAAECWRYGGGTWRKLGERPLDACVQTLFAGHCQSGGATYGRWADQTLRLVPGRVEVSGDNRSFRTLAPQFQDCGIPPIR